MAYTKYIPGYEPGIYLGRFWSYERGYFDLYSGSAPAPGPVAPSSPPAPPASPPDLSALAGATYGRKMPLFAGGKARIGGAIVFGPYGPGGATTIGTHASFGISFGVPANVSGTRTLYEIALDSKVAWTSTSGTTNIAAGTFAAETFTARFYQGTLTQSADSLETTIHGVSNAVAYRPQMMIFFENLPLAAFGNKIPYVAAMIGDTTAGADPNDGINLGEALERVAYSPWAGYTSSTFEAVDISDVVEALLIDQNYSMVDLVSVISRAAYVNLDLLQNDMLRVRDHGALVTPDITLTLNEVLAGDPPIAFVRKEASNEPRERELITIDPAADYTWVPSKAQRTRFPVVVSAAVGKETATIPVVMGTPERIVMVNYAQYVQENARKMVRFSAGPYGYAIEPGDRVALVDIGDGFEDEIYKITETIHGANYAVQCTGEAMMRCSIDFSVSSEHITCYNNSFIPAVTTTTFVAADLGAPDTNRKIILGIEVKTPAIGTTFTSVTIGGVAATADIDVGHVNRGMRAAIFRAAVPTGATGDVVITMSGTFNQLTINIWRKISTTLALSDTANTPTNYISSLPVSTTIDVPTNGLLIVAATSGIGATFTLSGVTPDCSYVQNAQTTGQRTGASYTATTAETNRTLTLDPSSHDMVLLAAASYVP